MAPREDLISSAISFLQDPSVASSPLEKRIEFLKSKNLTHEEIEIAISRANEDPSSHPQPPAQNSPLYPQPQYRRPSPGYGYNYNPYGDWQPPPPDLPKRDWRDWFIMATVVGGAGYGLWVLTQRYIKPLIVPPTPPQLQQDKAAIDEQFNRAFALLDTLSSDTAALKQAEEARTQRLDGAIAEVEAIVSELKASNSKREEDSKRVENEVRTMKEYLPRGLGSVRETYDKQLRELSGELASLKMLIGNRMGVGSSSASPMFSSVTAQSISGKSTTEGMGSTKSGRVSPAPDIAPGSSSNVTGVNAAGTVPPFTAPMPSAPASSASARPKSSAPFGAAGGKVAIPAWQMAAANKSGGAASTSSPIVDGAEAVAALLAS